MTEHDILNRDENDAIAHSDISGEFRLAGAVILQTFLDCRRLYAESGIDGLKGSEPYLAIAYPAEIMRFWCDVENINADEMSSRFRNAMRSEKTAAVMFNNLKGWPIGAARNV